MDSLAVLPVIQENHMTAESKRDLKIQFRSQDLSTTVFENVLRDTNRAEELEVYCKNQHSSELYYFIRDFSVWKDNPTEIGADNLFKRYINQSSEYALNVDGGCPGRILVGLENYEASKDIVMAEFQRCFDEAARDLRANFT